MDIHDAHHMSLEVGDTTSSFNEFLRAGAGVR